MVVLESLCTVFYWHFIATMAVSLANSEIFSVKEWCDLEIGQLKMAPFDRSCTTFYWLAIVSIKGAYSSLWNSPQNYGTPLVNEITQCYLPPALEALRNALYKFKTYLLTYLPDRGYRPVRMKGWVGLVGWLHTEMVYPSTNGHPSLY